MYAMYCTLLPATRNRWCHKARHTPKSGAANGVHGEASESQVDLHWLVRLDASQLANHGVNSLVGNGHISLQLL